MTASPLVGQAVAVLILVVVVGFMLGAVVLLGVGDRLSLPWPALMVLLGAVVAFTPGFEVALELDPSLIMALFLPPLLFATAQRTSWAVFRARWRTVGFLAVALVVVTIAAVAGAVVLMIPGLAVSAAIALGAMVAPPDPVAVDAIADPLRIPRRLLAVLDSEGLFNDAVAVVVFQAAVYATVQGTELRAVELLVPFVLGALGAVVLGLAVARAAQWVTTRVGDTTGRSALTLVLPFAVYLAAEEVHVSGVVAVVVVALQTRATTDVDDAAARLVQGSFWDVVELLVTGIAFGLIGLELRSVADEAGPALPTILAHAAVVVAVMFAVRGAWLVGAWRLARRSGGPGAAPRTAQETLIVTWCGMRGLATLALAMALPHATRTGAPFPFRAEIVVIAAAVLVGTLLVPAFTLPLLVHRLGVAEEADVEHAAERAVTHRARRAAREALTRAEARHSVSDELSTELHQALERLESLMRGGSDTGVSRARAEHRRRDRATYLKISGDVLAAARAEVLAARRSPEIDPHAADRVLQRLDMRTVLLT